MGTICSMWSMFLPHSLQWLFGSGYIYILDFIGTFVYFSHAWMQHLLTWNPQKKRISFGFGWWFRWFYDLFFDNFIPCLFCGLKLQHVKATPPFAALNSSTVDCLGPHWWRLGRSARQPRVSKWFHLNIIIVYIYIYIDAHIWIIWITNDFWLLVSHILRWYQFPKNYVGTVWDDDHGWSQLTSYSCFFGDGLKSHTMLSVYL